MEGSRKRNSKSWVPVSQMTEAQRGRKRIYDFLKLYCTMIIPCESTNSRIGRDSTIVLVIGPTIGRTITPVTRSISAQSEKYSKRHTRDSQSGKQALYFLPIRLEIRQTETKSRDLFRRINLAIAKSVEVPKVTQHLAVVNHILQTLLCKRANSRI